MNVDYALGREKRRDFRYRLKRRTEEVLKASGRYAPSPQAIVDLGTAEGKMLQDISRRYPSSLCLGLDTSFPLLSFGKKRHPDLHLLCADVQNLGFLRSEKFDLIVAAAVIEHLVFPQDMLRESHRILKEGGVLIITTPHPGWEKIASALGSIKGEHHSVMAPQDLVNLCRKENFRVLEHYGFMLSPVGLWGEKKIERFLAKIKFDRFLPNHLVVAQKKREGEEEW